MQRLLHSEAYYAAHVDVLCRPDRKNPVITFQVRTGPRFLVRSVQLLGAEGPLPTTVALPPLARWGLATNAPATAQAILAAEQQVLRGFQVAGYPRARMAERKVVVDHAAREVEIAFRIDPGPPFCFGPLEVRGLTHLRESYVRGLVPWREGDPWNAEQIEQWQNRLARSGLFSVSQVDPEPTPDSGVVVNLKERKRRLVELGLGYTTDRGAGARGSWLHRNLFGGAEQLRLQLEGTKSLTEGRALFTRPQFVRTDQELLAELESGRETARAYTSQWVRTMGGLERTVSPHWRARGSLAFRLSESTQEEQKQFGLFSLPLSLTRDTGNELLDPTRGSRLTLMAAPAYDVLNNDLAFVRGQGTWTIYRRLARRWVLAGRVNAGSLMGASRGDVPPEERFYAGGGGSIRGYAYQSVGPLDKEGHPVGGRSLLEGSAEVRWRVSANHGLVLFADGGAANESETPDFREEWKWGAGLGWRYYLSLGLVRLDVAFLLGRRPGVDDPLQVYLSIGQAF